MHASISHEEDYAVAFVTLEGYLNELEAGEELDFKE